MPPEGQYNTGWEKELSGLIFPPPIYSFFAVLGLCCTRRLSPLVAWGLLAEVASLVAEHRLQKLWRVGLLAPWYVESSPTGNWTCVPCIGRRILTLWATREVPVVISSDQKSLKAYFHICKIGLKNSVCLLGLLWDHLRQCWDIVNSSRGTELVTLIRLHNLSRDCHFHLWPENLQAKRNA